MGHFLAASSLLVLFSLVCEARGADSRFSVELESGPLWQSRNDVRIPSESGTTFSLVNLGSGPVVGFRLYAGYQIAERHSLRALWAPLSLNLSGPLPSTISYQGQTFQSGVPVDALYQFNSYRLTYRYLWVDNSDWRLHVGFTAKIRDAEIRLEQGGIRATRENVGFVPLLYLGVERSLTERWELLLDADGLAAPQGRAFDIALSASYRWNDQVRARIGYRTVEGGSEGGGSVYTFAWLHSAVAAIRYEW